MSKSLTHEQFTERFYAMHEPNGYTVLSQFTKSSERVLVRHNTCGKEYYAFPYNLYMGKGCRACNAGQKSEQEFQAQLQEKWNGEYSTLEPYQRSGIKVLTRHNKCGYEYKALPDALIRGHGCPKCAGLEKKTTQEVSKIISETDDGEYTLVGEYTKNNGTIDVLHKTCNTTFKTTYTLFVTGGSRCPLCNSGYRRTAELFKKEFNLITGDEYTLLSDFTGTMNKITVRHNSCGNEYSVLANSFLRGNRCPECAYSKGEMAIQKYLSCHNIQYVSQYKTPECKRKQELPFDFAVYDGDKLKCLIEYQGEQHYRSLARFGWKEKFDDRQRNDNIKRKYCADNGIKLIEIPYTVKDINEYLKNELSA